MFEDKIVILDDRCIVIVPFIKESSMMILCELTICKAILLMPKILLLVIEMFVELHMTNNPTDILHIIMLDLLEINNSELLFLIINLEAFLCNLDVLFMPSNKQIELLIDWLTTFFIYSTSSLDEILLSTNVSIETLPTIEKMDIIINDNFQRILRALNQ